MNLSHMQETTNPFRAIDSRLGVGGTVGIVISRHGTGKTPFLVSLAIDRLLSGKVVLHVTLDQRVDHVASFYENQLDEMQRSGLLDAKINRAELLRRRQIHSFLDHTFSVEKLSRSVDLMRGVAGFAPEVLLFDGLGDNVEDKTVRALSEYARGIGCELWLTAVRHREDEIDSTGLTARVAGIQDIATVILDLQMRDRTIAVRLLRPKSEADLPFTLDPKTLLFQTR